MNVVKGHQLLWCTVYNPRSSSKCQVMCCCVHLRSAKVHCYSLNTEYWHHSAGKTAAAEKQLWTVAPNGDQQLNVEIRKSPRKSKQRYLSCSDSHTHTHTPMGNPQPGTCTRSFMPNAWEQRIQTSNKCVQATFKSSLMAAVVKLEDGSCSDLEH